MRIITTVAEMQTLVRDLRAAGSSIGCVPTMGSLHDGHASLISAAAEQHGTVITSIFVNPTQFAPTEDLSKYPRNLERDLLIVAQAGGTVVFAPSVEEMYPEGFASTIHVGGISDVFEGARRPGHFDGVATIVAKLLIATSPDEAYFGQKDYQQTLVIRALVRDLGFACAITVLDTVREADGLAMSSRNVYLTEEERAQASTLFLALSTARNMIEQGERSVVALEDAMSATLLMVPGLTIDYASVVMANTLATIEVLPSGSSVALLLAVRIGSTRLIDNMICSTGA
ncbi:pantoate--beta-alanine ligase [soil metagenome]